jgi:hypothetical protein
VRRGTVPDAHWHAAHVRSDAGLYGDESFGTLFCSDLLFQPRDPEPVIEDDPVPTVREAIAEGLVGPLAHDIPYAHHTDAIRAGTGSRLSGAQRSTSCCAASAYAHWCALASR